MNNKTIADNRNVTLVAKRDQFTLYRYSPTLFRPLLVDLQPMTFKLRMRYLVNYLRKSRYFVYYLACNKDIVSMCVIVPGGGGLKRIKSIKKGDIYLGLYYVRKDQRGKGYAKMIVSMSLENSKGYKYVYALISNKNIPSQHVALASGFQLYQHIKIKHGRHYNSSSDDATHGIYRLENV